MLFFDKSQLLILLAFMLMIDVVDLIMLSRRPETFWTVCLMTIVCSFVVADAAFACKTAGDKETKIT